jgi:hypothetical protein
MKNGSVFLFFCFREKPLHKTDAATWHTSALGEKGEREKMREEKRSEGESERGEARCVCVVFLRPFLLSPSLPFVFIATASVAVSIGRRFV